MVGINQMRPTQRIQTAMLVRGMEKLAAGTVVLQLHVDETGKVVKAVVHESSGTTAMDDAAKGAMRKMTFLPYMEGGAPISVTVIAPMHFPAVN